MIVVVKDGSIELFKYDNVEISVVLEPAHADIEDVKTALSDALMYLEGGNADVG